MPFQQKTVDNLAPKIRECLAVIGEKTFELSTIIGYCQDTGIPLPKEAQKILHGFRGELNSVMLNIACLCEEETETKKIRHSC